MPPGWTAVSGISTTQACQWAFDIATLGNTPLLVLAAGAYAGCEAIGALLEGLDQDPLFGVAIPRLSDGETGRILVTEAFGAAADFDSAPRPGVTHRLPRADRDVLPPACCSGVKWRRTSDCSATLNGNCGTRSPSWRFGFVAPDSGRCSATRSLSTCRRHRRRGGAALPECWRCRPHIRS